MLVIELEAVGAEEWPRLERQRAEIDCPALHPIQGLKHRNDFRRSHVRAEFRDLLICALALANEIGAALEAADETDPIKIGAVERPVLDIAHVRPQERPVPIPRPRRDHRQRLIADIDAVNSDQRIATVAIFPSAEARTGRQPYCSKSENGEPGEISVHAGPFSRWSAAPRRRRKRRASSSNSG